jgi:uracil-DNA glycosylase
VAIIADKPLFDDVKNGVTFSGEAGLALAQELSRVGVQDTQCYLTTLWSHAYPSKDEWCERDYHERRAMELLKDRKVILMLGTEVLDLFTGYNADTATGTIVKSKHLKKATIIAGPSVATINRMPIGEYRLALELFAEHYRKVMYPKGEK